MPNPTVFVACKFRPDDSRSYTYTWDGEPLAPGDMVKVPDNRSDGWKAVTVSAFDVAEPPFQCKPILGRYEPDNLADGDDRDLAASFGDPLTSPLAF